MTFAPVWRLVNFATVSQTGLYGDAVFLICLLRWNPWPTPTVNSPCQTRRGCGLWIRHQSLHWNQCDMSIFFPMNCPPFQGTFFNRGALASIAGPLSSSAFTWRADDFYFDSRAAAAVAWLICGRLFVVCVLFPGRAGPSRLSVAQLLNVLFTESWWDKSRVFWSVCLRRSACPPRFVYAAFKRWLAFCRPPSNTLADFRRGVGGKEKRRGAISMSSWLRG